jgi:serine/threonine protein kinase
MLQPDEQLGIYRLISRIGAGGMGEVWKAEDTRLARTVAIKILPAAVASDPEAIARMRREARTAAQLYHANIATIHAFEEVGDRIFIVMEYIEGEALTSLIRRGPLAEADVCRIGKDVADALAAAHAKGIVHRDVKPDNIMVNGPRVKVLDFGIAKQIENQSIRSDEATAFMTKAGYILGTVHYMSPEQALGKPLDARTDIFSLGVVLYQAATGRLPFHGESPTETITQIVRDEPSTPRGISVALASIIQRCMAKNRDARFASAGAVAEALEERLGSAPTVYTGSQVVTVKEPALRVSARRWPWIAAMIALLIVIGIGAMIANRPRAAAIPASARESIATTTIATTTTIAEPVSAPPPPPPSTTTVEVRSTVTQAPVPTQTVAPVPTADDLYNEGMTRLVERQGQSARESFLAAIEADPHHARAHFRLGEMALFMRQREDARRHLEAALRDGDRLDARERSLTELGLALLDRDRPRAQELLRELDRTSPGDPDIRRFREMFGREDRPGPFRRPRRQR